MPNYSSSQFWKKSNIFCFVEFMTILLQNCRAENFEPGAGSESGDNPRTPASEPARSQPASPKKRRKVSRSQSIPAQVMASLFIDLIYIYFVISHSKEVLKICVLWWIVLTLNKLAAHTCINTPY